MSQPSETTTTVKNELGPEQKQLIEPAIPIALEHMQNPPKLPDFSGIAGFTPAQLQAQQMMLDASGAQQPVANAMSSANQMLMNPAILSPESNPALQATIDAAINPIQQQLFTETLPQLGTSAEQSGQYGSTRQGVAEGLATTGAQQAAVNVAAPIANAGYQSGLDAMTKSLALAPQTMAGMTTPALTTGAVGDVQQALAQSQLTEQYSNDIYNQIAPWLAAQEVAAMATGIPVGSTQTTAPTNTVNPLMQIAGTAVSTIPLLAALI